MARLKVKTRYATIPNNILNSNDISFRAKGIWAYIYSKPDGWNFSIKNIANQSKEGIEAVRNAIKELENTHLLKRTKFQNELGHWDIEYLLLEAESGKPYDGKPDDGKPYDGKSTNNSKKELSKKEVVINIVEVSTNDEKGINKRLKGYQQMIKDNNTKNNTYNISYVEELAKGNNTKELEDKFSISKKDVVVVAEYMIDWRESTGRSYKNYKSAMFNWIRNKLQEGKIKKIEKVYQEEDDIDYDNYKPE